METLCPTPFIDKMKLKTVNSFRLGTRNLKKIYISQIIIATLHCNTKCRCTNVFPSHLSMNMGHTVEEPIHDVYCMHMYSFFPCFKIVIC